MSSTLNKSQKDAVEYVGGPLLIIAGAGTGKTTVITRKIAHLIENSLAKPEEILALTFTEKASSEMQSRVDDLLFNISDDSTSSKSGLPSVASAKLGYVDLQISTFHSFCQRLIEEFGAEMGLPSKFRLLTETDAWLLMRENIYDFNLDYYRPLGNPNGQIHALLNHFSKCMDELVDPKEYLDYVEGLILDKDDAEIQEKNRLIELANAYHKYSQMLLDKNVIDFGSLIFYCVKLLKTRPNILKLLQQRYKYILVDEFQDVNWAQYQFVKLLTGDNGQLTVVGDDDQAIYSFRGSNVSIIMRFMEDFKNAKEIVLTENYRSNQEILDLAYKSIIHNNPNRLEEKLKIDKKLISKIKDLNPQSNVVQHIQCQTLDQEVESVIKKIAELKKDKNTSYDDIAILVRANNHASPFLNALETHGIPYEYLSSSGLYRQPIVLDAMAFLQTLENIHDDKSIYRLLRLPYLDFTENDLQKLTSGAKKKSISYYEILKSARGFHLSEAGVALADKLIATIHIGLKNSRLEKPTVVLYEFMENSGYLKYLTSGENDGNKEVIRQIYHLKQLFDMIRSYEDITPDCHIAGFVEHYNQIIESGDNGKIYQPEDTPDSINIMTVHSAKGLEYKYVFIVNCVEERFPTRRKGGGIDLPEEFIKIKLDNKDFHYEEERRLFYVAVTRAKEKLYFTSAVEYGGSRDKKISRFLSEIDLATDSKDIAEKKLTKNDSLVPKTNKKIQPIDVAEIVYTAPTNFSFSQINSYERCPYQYKLANVIKIPTKGSAHFSFGNTIHNTMQKFYERIQELNSAKQDSLFGLPKESKTITAGKLKIPELAELLKIYDDCWISDWYQDKKQRESYYKNGKEVLKIFYNTQDKFTMPISLEGSFKIRVGAYVLQGRIDRIDLMDDGTMEIIDYKTGKSKESLTSDDKRQLLIYQIATETLPQYGNFGKVGKLTFYYINDNLKTSFLGTEKEKEKLEEKLLKTIEFIRSGVFSATPDKHTCQNCDFKNICEFRQL